MYQILVVDDERIERNGIKMLLRHMQMYVRLQRLQMEEMRLNI